MPDTSRPGRGDAPGGGELPDEVAVGARNGRRAVVETGVEEGERVVLAPPARLADGDRVQVTGGS